jgi:hypothetical protein
MKKIKFLVTFLALGAAVTSCEDAIDIEQVGRLDAAAAIQNVEDLQSFLLGTYALLDTSGEIGWNAAFTDEITRALSHGGQWNQELDFQLDASSAVASQFWLDNYRAVNQANRLLEAGEALGIEDNDDPDDDSDYNDVIAQARMIRAFSLYQLQNYFSPDLMDDSALGVINLDFVPAQDAQLLRGTNAETYDLIQSDIDFARANLINDSSTTFISQDMVDALAARIAINRGNYGLAESLSQALLDEYGLADQDTYFDVFTDDSDAEIIWKLERTFNGPYDRQGATGSPVAGGWAGANFAFGGPGIGGSPFMEVDRGLFNLIQDDDVRRGVIIDEETSLIADDFPNVGEDYRETDQLIVNKYRGSENRNLMNDLKIFRSSEMLLIAAEANAALGNLDEAEDLIDQLTDARRDEGEPDDDVEEYSSAQEAFQAILVQRRIELAFEGHRWKDIKRLGERANRGVDRSDLDCAFNNACELAPSSFKFTLPLPIAEFDANPGLREQQNPGY